MPRRASHPLLAAALLAVLSGASCAGGKSDGIKGANDRTGNVAEKTPLSGEGGIEKDSGDDSDEDDMPVEEESLEEDISHSKKDLTVIVAVTGTPDGGTVVLSPDPTNP